jgi:hypothetical protein
MTKIGILGDTHMNRRWVLYALNKFYREGITKIIQVGDFGIYNHAAGQYFFKDVRVALERYGQTLYVVEGNHEDYDYLETFEVQGDGFRHLRHNILVPARGHRWEWDGVSFVALGGAPSVDRSWRIEDQRGTRKLWWAQEAITPEDVAKTIDGGYADVMIGHDAPFVPTIDARISGNPQGFKQIDLDYAYEGRKLMQKAFENVAPRIFLHGHYHFKVDEVVPIKKPFEDPTSYCHVLCFTNEMTNHALGVLDTETVEAYHLDTRADYAMYVNDPNNWKRMK